MTADEVKSLQGEVIMRMGGPITWTVAREKQISRSSCEAEIKVVDKGTKIITYIRYSLKKLERPEVDVQAPVYNNNKNAIDWT